MATSFKIPKSIKPGAFVVITYDDQTDSGIVVDVNEARDCVSYLSVNTGARGDSNGALVEEPSPELNALRVTQKAYADWKRSKI